MVTGHLPFRGGTGGTMMEAILNHPPVPAVRLNPDVPVQLDAILAKCLEKDCELRYQHAADLGSDLKRLKRDLSSQSGSFPAPDLSHSSFPPIALPEPEPRQRPKSLKIAAVAGAVVLIAGAVYWRAHSPGPLVGESGPLVVRPLASLAGAENMPAFSPDGNTVAFSWDGPNEDNRDIYLKLIDSGEPLRLTSSPQYDTGPIFSPDGRRIAFSTLSGRHLGIQLHRLRHSDAGWNGTAGGGRMGERLVAGRQIAGDRVGGQGRTGAVPGRGRHGRGGPSPQAGRPLRSDADGAPRGNRPLLARWQVAVRVGAEERL